MKQRGMFVFGGAVSSVFVDCSGRALVQAHAVSIPRDVALQLRFLPVYKRLLKEKQRGLLKKVMN